MPDIFKYCIFLFCLSVSFYSQDTINFKQFDTLKTNSEDNHKYILKDSIKVEQNRLPVDISLGKRNIIDPDNFDVRLFRKINNSHSPFKTKVFNTFDNSMLPVAILLPPAQFIYGRVRQKTYDENTAYLAFTSELTTFTVTFALKTIIKRRRPLEALQNVNAKKMPVLDVYSFPSGHSSTTFSLATMYALRYPDYPLVYIPMFAWAATVGYGRPYFGMHYPSDVLAGALIGSGSSILIYSLRYELFRFKNRVLKEEKNDDGSINAGVLTFFAGSFFLSAVFDNFIFKEDPGKKFFISPWMDSKRSGLNVKWKL